MDKPGETIPAGNPIKPSMPLNRNTDQKQAGNTNRSADPPRTKSGPLSTPGGAVDNTSK